MNNEIYVNQMYGHEYVSIFLEMELNHFPNLEGTPTLWLSN